jgi:hypothetical protein
LTSYIGRSAAWDVLLLDGSTMVMASYRFGTLHSEILNEHRG